MENTENNCIKDILKKIERLHPELNIENNEVIYKRGRITDQSGDNLDVKGTTFSFQKKYLEILIDDAIKSGSSNIKIKGLYNEYSYHSTSFDTWEHYNIKDEREYDFSLEIIKGTPVLDFSI